MLKHQDQPNDGAWEPLQLSSSGRDMAKADIIYFIDANELAGFDTSDGMLDYFLSRYCEQTSSECLEIHIPKWVSRDGRGHTNAYYLTDGDVEEI